MNRKNPENEKRRLQRTEQRKEGIPACIRAYYVRQQQWEDVNRIVILGTNPSTGYPSYTLKSEKFGFHHVWNYDFPTKTYSAQNGINGFRQENGKWVPDIVATVP